MVPVKGAAEGLRAPWRALAVGLAILVVVAAYASAFRPLWIDEYAHFALGGLTPQEAVQAIVGTTGASLNQGHTGVYLLVDYWLMQMFGANLIALRMPSILSAVLLLSAAVAFLRVKGFGLPWQVLAVVAFAGQSQFMYYAGEARPYMPLAASSVACLAYYQYPLPDRRRWTVRALGILGIVLGSVSHPYFAVMGVSVALFSLWDRGYLRRAWSHRTEVVEFLNPRLLIPAVFLYTVVGVLTWAKGRPTNPLDPWYWFEGPEGAGEAFLRAHLQSLLPAWLPTGLSIAVCAVAVGVLVVRSGSAVRPPAVLIGVGLLTSVVFTMMSVMGNYWVFMRQWIAGIALVTLGVVWLLAAAWKASVAPEWPSRIAATALAGLIVISAVSELSAAVSRNIEQAAGWEILREIPAEPVPALDPDAGNDQWVRLGNLNVATGGPVWREVSGYYLRLRSGGAGQPTR